MLIDAVFPVCTLRPGHWTWCHSCCSAGCSTRCVTLTTTSMTSPVTGPTHRSTNSSQPSVQPLKTNGWLYAAAAAAGLPVHLSVCLCLSVVPPGLSSQVQVQSTSYLHHNVLLGLTYKCGLGCVHVQYSMPCWMNQHLVCLLPSQYNTHTHSVFTPRITILLFYQLHLHLLVLPPFPLY